MKLKELNIDKFDEFVRNNKYKSHFLQSAAWGELSKEKRNLTPYYLGLVDEKGNILAATLLLQKHLPLNLCYFYAPRGYVIDFNDFELLKIFTKELVSFAKKRKTIYIKLDPDIVWQRTKYNGEVILEEAKEKKIINSLLKLGYHHLGFTKNFETRQPRYTFRIDLKQDLKEIEKHFSKTTMQRINKSLKLATEVEIGSEKDLGEFYQLMMLTEDRKDFVSYPFEYYETLYRLFKKTDDVFLFLGKVNLEKIISILENDLADVEKEYDNEKEKTSKSAKNKQKELLKRKDKLTEDLVKYKKIEKEYGKVITLSAHMIVTYGNKAWVLYAGNHNLLTETYTNYHTYYEHLKFCKEREIEIYDQFGTIGDLSKDNPRLGLHEFKKKFGGDYIEFMGEFDYVLKPLYYFAFTKLVPIYRNYIKKRKKKELKDEVRNINN
ncbi:MAG: aminoacyltransferase [Bacilli bacterium]|jgi:peptidoglycan pentaglycine glycine transferase (the first glycine)|nr:aminoacyltransferase [Bacilli bacterium]